MMRRHIQRFAGPGLLALGLAACNHAAQQASAGTSPTPQLAGYSAAEQAAIAKARADSAVRPYTAADVHFMTGMISHHAQAILMAKWAPSHDASPSVRTLCERIINAQQDEIALMQQWLRDRQQPVPEAKPVPMKMMMNGMEMNALMPGMLSDEQLKTLDAARGTAFDRLFLTDMIQHHKGAVSMVADLVASPGGAQDDFVFKIASDINVDQTTEINRMERMLFMMSLEHPGSR